MGDIYYRVMVNSDDKGICIAAFQWFDEFDADKGRYLTNAVFFSEAQAQAWIDSEATRARIF